MSYLPTSLTNADARWLYREQQLYQQDRALHLPAGGAERQSVGAAWAQALRGGAALRHNAHNIIRDSREARYGAPCEWEGRYLPALGNRDRETRR